MNELKAIEDFGESCQGLRPTIFQAINTFVPVKKSRVFIRPNAPHKGAQDNPASLKKAYRQSQLLSVESQETALVDAIDIALAGGPMPKGFLAITRTGSGAVKAVPNKGKVIIASSVIALARLIDRGLENPPNVLAMLGLEGTPLPSKLAKKSAWTRVEGFSSIPR